MSKIKKPTTNRKPSKKLRPPAGSVEMTNEATAFIFIGVGPSSCNTVVELDNSGLIRTYICVESVSED